MRTASISFLCWAAYPRARESDTRREDFKMKTLPVAATSEAGERPGVKESSSVSAFPAIGRR